MSLLSFICHGNFLIVYSIYERKNEMYIILPSGFKIFLKQSFYLTKSVEKKYFPLISHVVAMTGEEKITLQMSSYLLSNYKAFSSKDLKRQQTDQLTCFY